MGKRHRREFLKLWAASMPGLFLEHEAHGQKKEPSSPKVGYRKPATIERYIDPLPRLSQLSPYGHRKGKDLYRIRMVEFTRPLHSQLPPARLWGYEGQYPGPLIEARRNRPIEVQWENRLPMRHILPIDPHIHGAMPPAPEVRTVPHLHGANVPSSSDGLPEKWFTPGHSVHYDYPNQQRAATLWYHDHAIGITRLNVYAGLSSFYLLRDDEELNMHLPSGEYEIPLVLQDRTLDEDGQLLYAPTLDDAVPLPKGVWGPMFFGELPVVNGAIYPYVEVRPQLYRIRLLNSCNSRVLNLYLNLAKRPTDIPQLIRFHQIGSDGGLMPQPVALEKLELAPGERADLIVDFSSLAGKTVTLSNDAPAPYPGWNVMNATWPILLEFMQFRVTLPAGPARSFSLPENVTFTKLNEGEAIKTRDFILTEEMDAQGRSIGLHINGKGYHDPVTETVTLGTLEKWRFINTSDDAHPMHVHLVQFQILHRQGFDLGAYRMNGKIEPVGSPRPPRANEQGWKDTATVNPGDILTILARFEGYTGKYVFHCHMLEHEDNDMMRPFVVVAPDQDTKGT
ncbi:multicopper oxidase family protein [Terriglobus albidus]|uniref:multicopper oxidase family protein n=1 Tax=Terriglobus albidus TaxID=1592106 RepID=UPI0021E0DD51|nr:multicopper oxidase domain-containing protein [Terriglobus albidus]